MLSPDVPEDLTLQRSVDVDFRNSEFYINLLAEFIEYCISDPLPFKAAEAVNKIRNAHPWGLIRENHQTRLAVSMQGALAISGREDLAAAVINKGIFEVYAQWKHFDGSLWYGTPWLENAAARETIKTTFLAYADKLSTLADSPPELVRVRAIIEGLDSLHHSKIESAENSTVEASQFCLRGTLVTDKQGLFSNHPTMQLDKFRASEHLALWKLLVQQCVERLPPQRHLPPTQLPHLGRTERSPPKVLPPSPSARPSLDELRYDIANMNSLLKIELPAQSSALLTVPRAHALPSAPSTVDISFEFNPSDYPSPVTSDATSMFVKLIPVRLFDMARSCDAEIPVCPVTSSPSLANLSPAAQEMITRLRVRPPPLAWPSKDLARQCSVASASVPKKPSSRNPFKWLCFWFR
ncbi:hypothetical protein C8R44DRAFT_909834 [Mycena epipterygia]|nr:hypothetical protein C8R44DRAFT_909834 [Mycena epipterygia]